MTSPKARHGACIPSKDTDLQKFHLKAEIELRVPIQKGPWNEFSKLSPLTLGAKSAKHTKSISKLRIQQG